MRRFHDGDRSLRQRRFLAIVILATVTAATHAWIRNTPSHRCILPGLASSTSSSRSLLRHCASSATTTTPSNNSNNNPSSNNGNALPEDSSLQLPEFGLYQVQEEMIVRRGVLEESIMTNNNDTAAQPLLAHVPPKVRGVGAGGFGGGDMTRSTKKTSKSKKKKSSQPPPPQLLLLQEGHSHAQVLRDQGVVRIDHVLSADVATELRTYQLQQRTLATQEVLDGTVPKKSRFSDVLLQQNRCDLVQSFDENVVLRALDAILNRSAVRSTLEVLLGPDAVLYEFSCLISDPGSQRQVVHPDTPYGAMGGLAADEAVLYTCFVSLQDIRHDMGPTVWLPRTHTKEAHEAFQDETIVTSNGNDDESPKDRLLRTTPAVLGMLPAGACGIFDSRLLHAGGANRSQESRAIFYVSFKNPKIGYPGNPASIRPEIGNAKLTLTQLGKELEAYCKGKPSRELKALIANLR